MPEQLSNTNSKTNLANLSGAKRELLEKFLSGDFGQPSTLPRKIMPLSPGIETQLSFAQERLWFLDQLNPGSAVYNVPLAVRLTNAIDASLLEKSINEIVRRHAALRTIFKNIDGRPVPVTQAVLKVELSTVDLSSFPPGDQEPKARTLLSEETARPFDLAEGPLIRTSLVRLDKQQSLFLVVMHHIVSDGWSLGLFYQELAAIYEILSRGESTTLPPLGIQYADYAAWQREWLMGELLEGQVAYWKEKLAGDLPILDLPVDHPRPAIQTFRGAREWVVLPDGLSESVGSLSQREGVTLFITLLAAFKLLLSQYTGQKDIIVGSPIANRPQIETESLIGFFLNNLALRSDMSGDPSFRELLQRVKRTALDAYAHQDLPFEKLIEILKPERSLSRTPVFQVYFNLFNFAGEIRLPGSDETVSFVHAWEELEENVSKFDLTLYAGQDGRKLKLALVYNTDLFEAATIRQMLARFQALLEQLVAAPQKSISELSPQLRTARCRTRHIRPPQAFTEFTREEIEQSIGERFAKQVQAYPSRIAIKSKSHEWTYRDLDRSVDRIARSIIGRSGGAEEQIALLFEHDAPMIAAMLGSLKAGRTYVPLDPHHPVDRLRQITKHSEATAVLTNSKNLALARQVITAGVQLINIDDVGTDSARLTIPPVAPDRLAYILYTSGSTGQPKGVMQNHRNVLHHIRVYTNNLHLNAGDRLTLLSSYCFDASVMDIFGALLNGATLVPIDVREEGFERLTQRMVEEEVTVYHSTPTVYRYFANTVSSQSVLSSVRLVVLGGEEVTRADVDLYKQRFSADCLFVNGFGPTEATVSLQNFVNQQTQVNSETVPVGLPVDDTEVLLLDEAGQPAAICGEIAIKSAHVALGYWRNPEATASSFVTGPTAMMGPQRLYKTGDLGRRLPDGSLKFEGRKDFQIKIRGFRIELGEIESALTQHPDIKESVVVARETAKGDKLLAAYVVAPGLTSINGELRDFLRQRLPDYMVPSSYVLLDALPLTASGKVNRLALPEPGNDIGGAGSIARPRTPTEKRLATLWSDLLGVREIGVDQNFFELGGHSLLAVRLFAQVEKTFKEHLPLATLFQAPTISQLAAILDQDRPAETKEDWSSLVAINPILPDRQASYQQPFFCVHAVGGNVLEYYDLASHLGTEQPFYGLQSVGLNGNHRHTRVEDMAAHYMKEMRELQPFGPYFIGGRSLGGMIAFEIARQLRAEGEEVGLLALLDTYPSGYAKLLRDQQTMRARLDRAMKWAKAHMANLDQLSMPDKVSYVTGKFRYLPSKMKGRIWRRVNSSFRHFGRPLPRALQDIYEMNSLAGREYTPQIYNGKVTLFWASSDLRASTDFVEGWRVLAAGGIDVHEIPGNHLDIVKEPHVRELAKKLKTCLATAQQASSR